MSIHGGRVGRLIDLMRDKYIEFESSPMVMPEKVFKLYADIQEVSALNVQSCGFRLVIKEIKD